MIIFIIIYPPRESRKQHNNNDMNNNAMDRNCRQRAVENYQPVEIGAKLVGVVCVIQLDINKSTLENQQS